MIIKLRFKQMKASYLMPKHKRHLRLTKRGKRARAVAILALAIALIGAISPLKAWFNGLDDLEQTQAVTLGLFSILAPYLYKVTN